MRDDLTRNIQHWPSIVSQKSSFCWRDQSYRSETVVFHLVALMTTLHLEETSVNSSPDHCHQNANSKNCHVNQLKNEEQDVCWHFQWVRNSRDSRDFKCCWTIIMIILKRSNNKIQKKLRIKYSSHKIFLWLMESNIFPQKCPYIPWSASSLERLIEDDSFKEFIEFEAETVAGKLKREKQ